jgi:hypothetical protein
MTALAADRATKRAGNQAKVINLRVQLGTDIVYAGGMVGRLSTGLCVAGAATAGMRIVGVACETVDNSAGASGVYADIMRGAFWFANSESTDAILDDDVGEKCYVVDDNVVAKLPTASRPVAGRVVAVDSTLGVLVEICGDEDRDLAGTLPAQVSNDFILPVASIIPGAVYDVGTTAANSTVTLPASAAENVTIYFVADGTKNGHTVQFRDVATAITTALTASKRFHVTATFSGGKWFANAYVSP